MTEAEALISINGTLIVQLVSFLIFAYLLNRVMFRPLLGTINERDAYVEKMGKDIENSEKEIENLNITVKQKETAVRDKAIEVSATLESEGGFEAERILAAASAEIMAIREKKESEIKSCIADAKKNLKREAEILADGIMEKVLDRRLGK